LTDLKPLSESTFVLEVVMTSEKQLTANRENAKRSTGPRTEEGKALSCKNAWKHGLTAQTITIAGEKPKEFESLRAQIWEEYQPAAGIERVLVDRLAGQAWRLRRIPVFEAALIKLRRAQAEEDRESAFLGPFRPGRNIGLALALIRDSRLNDTLGKLSRYEATLMNAFHRTLQQLLFLQDRRRRNEDRDRVVEVIAPPTNDRDAA
jgi:hypothetical protein